MNGILDLSYRFGTIGRHRIDFRRRQRILAVGRHGRSQQGTPVRVDTRVNGFRRSIIITGRQLVQIRVGSVLRVEHRRGKHADRHSHHNKSANSDTGNHHRLFRVRRHWLCGGSARNTRCGWIRGSSHGNSRLENLRPVGDVTVLPVTVRRNGSHRR